MSDRITITKIEIQGTRLIATDSQGRTQRFGEVKTERGAKAMLARRAKQFGLTVQNGFAA